MRSFEKHLTDFRERRVAVVAISVDPPATSSKLAAARGYTFPILSDPKAEVIRHYGVLHGHAGDQGQDIARPAEFLVDAHGAIRWENLTGDLLVRARPGAVLKAIDSAAVLQ